MFLLFIGGAIGFLLGLIFMIVVVIPLMVHIQNGSHIDPERKD